MSDETADQLPVEAQAALELEPKPTLKGHLQAFEESRHDLLCAAQSSECSQWLRRELPTNPRNGFEEHARCSKEVQEGAVVVAVFRDAKQCLGERMGSGWKQAQEHNTDKPTRVVDLPFPQREKELSN